MSPTIHDPLVAAHLSKVEGVQFRQAKAGLKGLKEIETRWRELVGGAIARAIAISGLSQKEVAGLTERDPAQVARWLTGAERPQFDALLAVEKLRQPLIVALAELAGDGVEIETVVRIRRRA